MTTFQIREARAEDAAALAELRYAFRAELHGATEDRDPFVRRCTEWMASHLADGSWHCWVAEFGDGGRGSAAAIAACIWTEIVGKLPNPNGHLERHAYVSSFVVEPAHRGGGLGSRLLRTVIAWCDAQGVDSIFLWPSERSKPLYDRNGFEPASGMMEHRRR